MATIYDYELETIKGDTKKLGDYRGQVIVVVNTASQCGLTTQYEGLQKLYEQYHDQGLEILGFPSNQFAGQEPGSNAEVESFCQLNYGVTFPLFAKTDVKGDNAHPLFQELIEKVPFAGFDNTPSGRKFEAMFKTGSPEELETNDVKWNFTKFLIDREGRIVERFEPNVEPEALQAAIEKLL